MPTTAPAEPQDPGQLPDGALCYGCGYKLVGRTLDEKCPECGMDVAPSWPVTKQAAGHPIHLKQLRLELLWLNALAFLAMISNISLAASAIVHVITRNAPAWQSASFTFLAVGLMGWCAVYVPLLMVSIARVRKHPNCLQMPGAWFRWHMYVGSSLAAIGFLACLVPAPIAFAISQHAGMWLVRICGFVLLTGALIQLLGSWMYAGSILRRARLGTQYPQEARGLWVIPAAIGMMVALAVCAWFASDTILAVLFSPLALASVVLAQRLLRALLAIRRAEKMAGTQVTAQKV